MNKINAPIGVLDSGVGGWTVLREMRRRLMRWFWGCTHYSLIKGQLRKLFPRAKLVDGAKGVAMEVERQLEQREWLGDGEGEVEIAIDTDGDL